jgi:hypothetical protein
VDTVEKAFEERLTEIDSYLALLEALEIQVREGPPRFGATGAVISTDQQRILYSSVYLQLYNLVEATITKCVGLICAAVCDGEQWSPRDLSTDLRREWVRYIARTHTDLSYDHRLAHSLELCEHLVNALPIGTIEIEKGGGGNWDDEEIFRFATRLGCTLAINADTSEAIKKPFRDGRGALSLIVKHRNDLAHGSVSFAECGNNVTVEELKDLKNRTALYLREVVASFSSFVHTRGFLSARHDQPEAQA